MKKFTTVCLIALLSVLGIWSACGQPGNTGTPTEVPRVFDYPVYSHWGWKTFPSRVPLTSENYDHIASHDVYHLPQEAFNDPIYKNVVDSVRVRNPKTVFTIHMQVMGWKPAWGNWGGYYKDIHDLALRHPDWSIRNIKGEYMIGKGWGTIYWNPMAFKEGLNDSLAAINNKWMEISGNDKPYVGIFADWVAFQFPYWSFADSTKHMDMNQNGIARGTSGKEYDEEERYYRERNIDIARAYREASKQKTYLFVPNVLNGRVAMSKEVGQEWDGMMFEGFQFYEPSSGGKAAMERALQDVYGNLSKKLVDPPLVFWQGLEYTTGPSTEIFGATARGLSVYHEHTEGNYDDPYDLPPDLKLGQMSMKPVWSGDTITTKWTSGTTTRIVFEKANGTNTLPWAYIAISAKGDTLRRGGGWPAEVPVNKLEVILDIFTQYLSDSYGQKINLTTLGTWSKIRSEALQSCEK